MKRILITTLFLLLIPVSASAQFYSTFDENVGLFVSATTTSTGVGAGLVVLTIAESNREPKKITAFLKHNGTRFRSALALGSGTALNDFAKLMSIPSNQLVQFEKKMRNNRKYLSSFCEPKNVSHKRTLELIAWIEREYPVTKSS